LEQEKAQRSDRQKNNPGTSVHNVWKSFTPEQWDNVYGIRELSRGRQKIGSKLVFFGQDKVYIGDDIYPLYKGLLELLFEKIPDEKLSYRRPRLEALQRHLAQEKRAPPTESLKRQTADEQCS